MNTIKSNEYNKITLIDRLNKEERLKIINLILPDDTAVIDLTSYNSASNQFIVPLAGYITVCIAIGVSFIQQANIYINNKIVANFGIAGAIGNSMNGTWSFVVDKGDSFYATGMRTGTPISTYQPMKGAIYE